MDHRDKYIYLFEKFAIRKNSTIDFQHISGLKKLYIVCYHINIHEKYPFIQFMLEKSDERLNLPFVSIDSHTEDINNLIIKSIKNKLTYICLNTDEEIIIKGLFNDSFENIYALVNVSNFSIQYSKYSKNINHCFVLPSEIINTGYTFDININENVKDLFLDLPELGILHEPKTKRPYPLPDAIYSSSSLEISELNSLIGCSKKQIIDKKYTYYFNTEFANAISDIFKNFDKNVRCGVNKYALFLDTFTIHIEYDNQITLKDYELDNLLKNHKQIYIQYVDKNMNDVKVDIIVRDYDYFVPLSYCEVDITDANTYEIV
jgi:hypothetical protein